MANYTVSNEASTLPMNCTTFNSTINKTEDHSDFFLNWTTLDLTANETEAFNSSEIFEVGIVYVNNGDPQWYTVLRLVLCSLGLVLNLLFLFTVARVPAMRTTVNYYLINLALADLQTIIVSLLFRPVISYLFSIQSPFKLGVLIFFNFCFKCLGFVSAFTIMMIGVERYIAIYWPFYFRSTLSKTKTIKIICALWLVSILFAMPMVPIFFLGWQTRQWQYQIMVGIYTFPYVISFIAVIVFYSLLISKMSRPSEMSKYSESSTSTSQMDRFQVVKMLLITALVFFACTGPLVILDIIQTSGGQPSETFRLICFIFLLVNSTVNMIIYNATSSFYQNTLKLAFTCQQKSMVS